MCQHQIFCLFSPPALPQCCWAPLLCTAVKPATKSSGPACPFWRLLPWVTRAPLHLTALSAVLASGSDLKDLGCSLPSFVLPIPLTPLIFRALAQFHIPGKGSSRSTGLWSKVLEPPPAALGAGIHWEFSISLKPAGTSLDPLPLTGAWLGQAFQQVYTETEAVFGLSLVSPLHHSRVERGFK